MPAVALPLLHPANKITHHNKRLHFFSSASLFFNNCPVLASSQAP